MSEVFLCPNCGEKREIEVMAGRRSVRCWECKAEFTITAREHRTSGSVFDSLHDDANDRPAGKAQPLFVNGEALPGVRGNVAGRWRTSTGNDALPSGELAVKEEGENEDELKREGAK